jgi:hypothetical protein
MPARDGEGGEARVTGFTGAKGPSRARGPAKGPLATRWQGARGPRVGVPPCRMGRAVCCGAGGLARGGGPEGRGPRGAARCCVDGRDRCGRAAALDAKVAGAGGGGVGRERAASCTTGNTEGLTSASLMFTRPGPCGRAKNWGRGKRLDCRQTAAAPRGGAWRCSAGSGSAGRGPGGRRAASRSEQRLHAFVGAPADGGGGRVEQHARPDAAPQRRGALLPRDAPQDGQLGGGSRAGRRRG